MMIDFAERAHRPSPSDVDRLGDEIAELAAQLHAATYRLLVRLRDFDAYDGWSGGFRSCAHWLSWRTGIGLGAAREKVRVARALEQLPSVSSAFEHGRISFAKARALTRCAQPNTEAELLELALHATAEQLERIVRAWRRAQRAEEAAFERERHDQRDLVLYIDDDGSYVVRGRLDPEVGALLARGLEAAVETLYPKADTSTSVGQRRADAIGVLAELALSSRKLESGVDVGAVSTSGNDDSIGSNDNGNPVSDGSTGAASDSHEVHASRWRRTFGRAERFQVVVHIDADALRAESDTGQSVLADGTRVSAETSRRIACDVSRVVMTHDAAGNTLDVGRRTRTVSASIRRALDHRDRGCRFPGCGNRFCDAHHVEHWADGGATRLDNLLLLCRRHHRAVHEDGFRVVVDDAGGFNFYRPNGELLPYAPAAPELTGDAASSLRHIHRQLGLRLDASTPMSRWNGERFDLDFTLRALYGMEQRKNDDAGSTESKGNSGAMKGRDGDGT